MFHIAKSTWKYWLIFERGGHAPDWLQVKNLFRSCYNIFFPLLLWINFFMRKHFCLYLGLFLLKVEAILKHIKQNCRWIRKSVSLHLNISTREVDSVLLWMKVPWNSMHLSSLWIWIPILMVNLEWLIWEDQWVWVQKYRSKTVSEFHHLTNLNFFCRTNLLFQIVRLKIVMWILQLVLSWILDLILHLSLEQAPWWLWYSQ